MATTCRRVAVGGGRVAIELAGQLWQSPILLQQKPESSLTAKRDLRPIDSKDPGVAAGSRKAPSDGVAGHESHFHQPLGVGVGKVQFFEHSPLRSCMSSVRFLALRFGLEARFLTLTCNFQP